MRRLAGSAAKGVTITGAAQPLMRPPTRSPVVLKKFNPEPDGRRRKRTGADSAENPTFDPTYAIVSDTPVRRSRPASVGLVGVNSNLIWNVELRAESDL
jgi:hypothetical protein